MTIEFAQPQFIAMTNQVTVVENSILANTDGSEIDLATSQFINDFNAQVADMLHYFQVAAVGPSNYPYFNIFNTYYPLITMLDFYISSRGTYQCDALSALSSSISLASSAFSTIRSKYADIQSFPFPNPQCTTSNIVTTSGVTGGPSTPGLLGQLYTLSVLGSGYVSLLSVSKSALLKGSNLVIDFAQPQYEAMTNQITVVENYILADCDASEISVGTSQFINDFNAEVAAVLSYYSNAAYTDDAYRNIFNIYYPLDTMLQFYISAGTCKCDALNALSPSIALVSSAFSTIRARYETIQQFPFQNPSCASVCPNTNQCSTTSISASSTVDASSTVTSNTTSSDISTSASVSASATYSDVNTNSVVISSVTLNESSSIGMSPSISPVANSSTLDNTTLSTASTTSSVATSSGHSSTVDTGSSTVSSTASSAQGGDIFSTVTLPYTTARCRLGPPAQESNAELVTTILY